MPRPHLHANRRSWNAVTRAHQGHKRDQAAFLRDGGSTLFPDELELLGPVEGLRILHAQCNCGQDSLSLAGFGADVVGVDLADEAIAQAWQLSLDSGIPARFERAEIITWMRDAAADGQRFDVVFASYGALPWIEDLDAWVRAAAALLAPSGRLVVLEFHPLLWSFDAHGNLEDDYFATGGIELPEGVTDYVARSGAALAPMGYDHGDDDFTNPEPAVAFQWTVAGLVQAVADSGLRAETLREYPHANGCRVHEGMREISGRRFVRAEGTVSLPLMLGLSARLIT